MNQMRRHAYVTRKRRLVMLQGSAREDEVKSGGAAVTLKTPANLEPSCISARHVAGCYL